MKVAIIHDSFLYMGGAERVATALFDMFPGAVVYTAFIPQHVRQQLTRDKRVHIVVSPFNFPFVSETIASLLKPLVLNWWRIIDLSGFDLVISSSHSFSAKSVTVSGATRHISYIHSPPRYLYNSSHQLLWIHNPLLSPIIKPLLFLLRRADMQAAKSPHMLLTNSKVVQKRIQTCYHRDSVVIPPPVSLPTKIPSRKPSYYVCFSHLLKQKGIDIAIRASNIMKLPLLVVGSGPEETNLRSIAGPTVSFMGWVPEYQIGSIYSGAIALIYPSVDEDFGIVPVEAMAHGVPVIAFGSGGTMETVVEGQTGLFFNSFTENSLIAALDAFQSRSWSSAACRRQARKFSSGRFITHMHRIIQQVCNDK